MEYSTTLTVNKGDTSFALPSDFKCEVNPEMSDSSGAGYSRIWKIIKDGVEYRDVTTADQPRKYRIWHGQGLFDVAAGNAFTFPLAYIRYLPALDSDADQTDVDFIAFLNKSHEAIEFFALARCYERMNNPQSAVYYQNEKPPGRFERRVFQLILEDDQASMANVLLQSEYPG
jgi:hypothetical protein